MFKKMAECSSHQRHNIYPNLNEQQRFKLNKISKIKDYFVSEIKERESMSEKLSKYLVYFEYFDKTLIVLSVTTGSFSIASFVTVIGAPVGIVSAHFSLAFSIFTGIVKKLLNIARNKTKNIIKLLC